MQKLPRLPHHQYQLHISEVLEHFHPLHPVPLVEGQDEQVEEGWALLEQGSVVEGLLGQAGEERIYLEVE